MTPTLEPGDRLVVVRLGRLRPGDLVALHDPAEPARLLVKRIAALGPAGVEVRGDNEAASRDSRAFGAVQPSGVVGRAVYRYFPPTRAGRLPRPGPSSGTLARMGLHEKDIDRLLEPDVTADLETVPVAELRVRRDACQRAEVALSYVRRVLQGELDIVAAELEARGRGVRGDARQLVQDLPTILAGIGSDAPAQQHAHEPRLTMAGVAEGWTEQKELALEDLVAEVLIAEQHGDETHQPVLPGANLGAFGDEELRALAASLRAAETSVSSRRRALHDRIDQLQTAIVERYKVGAADADSLLK